MRRELITWSVVAAVVVGGFFATVVALNATLYSAGGFVRGYLEAIARHDVTAALELAGSVAAGDASTELLDADALGELTDLQLVSDEADEQGVHRVVYSFTSNGRSGETSFDVRRQGTLLGLFPTWSFESTPLAVLQISPLNSSAFTVGEVDVIAPQQDRPSPYLVFAPMTYELSRDSLFLAADPTAVTAAQPGAAVIAAVDIRPTDAMVQQVQTELDDHLDSCATQTVLLPTDCPFGQPISNRIASTPEWSIAEYPMVTLVPGPQPESWLMPETDAAAHLLVDIRSLFDGTVSTFDEDVPFTATYVVTFLSDDELLITGQN